MNKIDIIGNNSNPSKGSDSNKKERVKLKYNPNAQSFDFGSIVTSFNSDFSQIEIKTIKKDNKQKNESHTRRRNNKDYSKINKNNQQNLNTNHKYNKGKNIEIYREIESEETNDSKGEEEHDNDDQSQTNSKKQHKISFDTQKTQENQENQINSTQNNNNSQNPQQTNNSNNNSNKQNNEHYLSQELQFLYQPRISIDKYDNQQFIQKGYEYQVHNIGQIKSVEDYLSIYLQMEPPSKWNDHIKIGLFKNNEEPQWELHPQGGCLILKFPKNAFLDVMDQIWEELLISMIGDHLKQSNIEVYENISGILMNIRFKENFIEIWIKDSKLKYETALEIKNYLDISDKQPFYFKLHQKSIENQSLKKEMEKLKYDETLKSYKSYICNKKKKI